MTTTLQAKPHQERGHAETWAAIDAGVRGIVVTSPTGGGKTFLYSMAVEEALRRRWRTVIYTDRRLLTKQSGERLADFGIRFGHMAAGYDPALLEDVQIASMQTIQSRVVQRGKWNLHEAQLVIVDEAHQHAADRACDILYRHHEAGAFIVGYTATPLDLPPRMRRKGEKVHPWPGYTKLIIAGTNSELRKCGLHVRPDHYSPDEPELKGIGKTKTGEYSEAGLTKAIMTPTIFGRVVEHWRRLNPSGEQTILFAPGVPESRWFAEQFRRVGHTAAHLDSDTPDEERDRIIAGSQSGLIQVVCNRFVLREGIDMPWLRHCIFATAFGSIKSYLQAGGRVMRSFPGQDCVTIQDHGGHYWRFGSLSEDREWKIGDTSKSVAESQQRAAQEGEPQPIVCCNPKCRAVRRTGAVCPYCGHQQEKSVRHVVQLDGELKKQYGPPIKVRKQEQKDAATWKSCLYAAARAGMTFKQAEALFKKRRGYYPNFNLKPAPDPDSPDWNLPVARLCPWMLPKEWRDKTPT